MFNGQARFFVGLIFAAIALIIIVIVYPNFDNLNGFTNKSIIIGRGIGNVEVRKTSLGEVGDLLGKNYNRIENEGTITNGCENGICSQKIFTDISFDYSNYGLRFLFRRNAEDTNEANLKLLSINIYCVKRQFGCAFTGKTELGTQLGTSRKQVLKNEGNSDTYSGLQASISKRSGINIFFQSTEYLKIREEDMVEAIQIFSPLDFDKFKQQSV